MKDYYSVLGVKKEASDKEIKAAYRKVAKKWHPDVNSDEAATKMFQQINDAYEILGSPERRALYDAGNYDAAIDPFTQATEAELYPVGCDGCGAVSAQPRFVQYGRVFSLLLFSIRSKPCGVFCVSCASKRLFWNSLVTGMFGWLSFWGFFWTIEVIFINLFGGTKNPAINAFVLGKQAAYFFSKGDPDIAIALAEDSISFFKKISMADPNYEMGKSGSEVAQAILRSCGQKKKRVKSRWSGWTKPSRASFLAFSLPVICWVMIIGSHGKETKSGRPSYNQAAPTNLVSPSEDVLFLGRNGSTYRLSQYDAKKAIPILNSLENLEQELDKRNQKLQQRYELIDRQRGSLYSDYDIDRFNDSVDKWNSDNQALKAEFNSFNIQVERYYNDIERLGILVNR
jgi:hypothetical protein